MNTETIPTADSSHRRPEMRPGAVFADRFVLRDELGHGGVATVYLAWDRTRVREVALKVWHPESELEAAVDRFGREVLLATRINHPAVIKPLDAGTWRGVLWFSMPVVAGGTLRELLQEQTLSLETALDLAVQACVAIEAVHAASVLHRDIKTGNLMVSPELELSLADFGLARTIDHAARGTADERLEGSPLYMPPERFAGKSENVRSDLWALGVTLYELFTGHRPFAGHDIAVICATLMTSRPAAPSSHMPELPPALDELILAMLARSPDDRPANVASVRAALEAVRIAGARRAA